MPKFTATREEIKGETVLPEGMYSVRLDGFKPILSSKKDSVNLRPQMKIVNHPDLNDKRVFYNLNTKAKWTWADFCHAFGVPLEDNTNFPGDFIGADDKPEVWQYAGPLLGQVGQLYVIESDNNKGGKTNNVRFFVCRLPGCQHEHNKHLK